MQVREYLHRKTPMSIRGPYIHYTEQKSRGCFFMVSELSEQIALVRELRKRKIVFCSVPNGGLRKKGEAVRLKMSGVEKGVPDLLIFDPPPNDMEKSGVALELKIKGNKLSKAQEKWLELLEARGWVSLVCYGASEALEKLKGLGYGVVDEGQIYQHRSKAGFRGGSDTPCPDSDGGG